ncbi:MAG: helix-turn-helix transcriptional regulator [Chitinispirillales bacterium]|jgi:DNA-binding Xre family transcriptional regulator|nr:helix-turn-helix transcriptional regulator [Chitinispirillales bacterium]
MRLDIKKLDLAMARRKWDTPQLAEAAKIKQPSLSYWRKGRPIRPSTAGKLAEALGVDVAEIVEGGAG